MSPLSAKDYDVIERVLSGKAIGFRYADVARWLRRAGYEESPNAGGSHRVWVHPSGRRLPLKTDGNRELLPVYVKKVAKQLITLREREP